MSAFRHGLYVTEAPTSLLPPVTVNSAMPVALVTAPVHLSKDPYAVTNVPRLCFNYNETVSQFGFSMRPEIWNNYTAPGMIFSQFALYATAPIVLINVLDPTIHNEAVADEVLYLDGMSAVLGVDGVLIDTVDIQGYEAGIHYTLAFNRDGFVVVNAKEDVDGGMTENEELVLSFTKLAPEKVDIYDVIGGYDISTGKTTGLALMNEIFPRFRLVPGLLLAPKFSADPVVAAVMETMGDNINGHFRCITLCDVPTMIEGEEEELVQHRYTDVPAWKNQNNIVSTRQVPCFPMVRLGNQMYDFSAQLAGLIGRTDFENGGIPYNSPSNKNMQINGLCYASGEELVLNNEIANFLNGQGIMTAINFTNGWVGWGNRTAAFPGNPDVKDNFIPIRRMFDWIGNTIVLSYWSQVDFPLTPRLIDTIVDSVNMWLNGLASRQFILGGRIEFLSTDNPQTDVLNGIARFRISVTPPPPFEQGEFILEYDPAYLQTLFAM